MINFFLYSLYLSVQCILSDCIPLILFILNLLVNLGLPYLNVNTGSKKHSSLTIEASRWKESWLRRAVLYNLHTLQFNWVPEHYHPVYTYCNELHLFIIEIKVHDFCIMSLCLCSENSCWRIENCNLSLYTTYCNKSCLVWIVKCSDSDVFFPIIIWRFPDRLEFYRVIDLKHSFERWNNKSNVFLIKYFSEKSMIF